MVLYDAFEMMIIMVFYFDLSKKNFCQNLLKLKNFKQKLRLQMVEAEAVEAEAPRVEAEAIQKLPLSHYWFLVMNNAEHRKFFLSLQFATPQTNFNFLNPQLQVRNCTFKSFSSLPQVRNKVSGFLNPQPQICSFVVFKVRNHKILEVFRNCIKAGSHRSRQRQRYRSVAVTSNVKVFTQKILAVTEVIFSISSVLR